MTPGPEHREISFRSYLVLVVLTAQLPFAAFMAMLALQARLNHAWLLAVGLLLLGVILAVLVARRLTLMTTTIGTLARAVAKGEPPAVKAVPVRELNALSEMIATAASVRRKIEGRLRADEVRLTTLLASTPTALIAVDASRRVTLFNRAAEAMFGCSALAAVGSPADRFFSQRFLRMIDAHLDGAHGRLRALAAGNEGTPVGFRGDAVEFAIDAQISRVDTRRARHHRRAPTRRRARGGAPSRPDRSHRGRAGRAGCVAPGRGKPDALAAAR
jgi:PAS domain-containing protein